MGRTARRRGLNCFGPVAITDRSTPTPNPDLTMTTDEVARRLVAYCRQGQWEAAQRELYADDAVSWEPEPGVFEQETRGLEGIIAKGRKFDEMVEAMHSIEASDPVVSENSFACVLKMDATMKGHGRMKMTELCVYDVKDGKIVREEFHF